MIKRLFIICGAVILTAQVAIGASLSNFNIQPQYTGNGFSDVNEGKWYYESAIAGQQLRLIDGYEDGTFRGENLVTIAECVKMAAEIHSIYHRGNLVPAKPETGKLWYEPYIKYAIENQIIGKDEYARYDLNAVRSDFAKIISKALPEEALTPVNQVENNKIPDVKISYSYGEAVYLLYRAGVLAGGGRKGEFYPTAPLTRSEAAAAVVRMADSSLRIKNQKVDMLSPMEIYEKCSPAVFFIEILNEDDEVLKIGSGFFIDSTGVAVTNWHVIGGVSKARVKLANGETRKIEGIYSLDMKSDSALIKVEGKDFPVLKTGDYEPKTGAEIFTIGNPVGLINSFSQGIVSTANRVIDEVRYIQIDAAISPGSSGGALLDAGGNVIGITSAGVSGGQNLNLAIPIGEVLKQNGEKLFTLEDYPTANKLYEGFYPTPDFGHLLKLIPVKEYEEFGGTTITYETTGLGDPIKLTAEYTEVLKEYMFYDYGEVDGRQLYYNGHFNIFLFISHSTHGDQSIFVIELYGS